jgi:hypothetical protein
MDKISITLRCPKYNVVDQPRLKEDGGLAIKIDVRMMRKGFFEQ